MTKILPLIKSIIYINYNLFIWYISRFEQYKPYTLFNKILKRTPKIASYKLVFHRLKLMHTFPSCRNLEFKPLMLSPKTVQGLNDSITKISKSRVFTNFFMIIVSHICKARSYLDFRPAFITYIDPCCIHRQYCISII